MLRAACLRGVAVLGAGEQGKQVSLPGGTAQERRVTSTHSRPGRPCLCLAIRGSTRR